MNSFLQALDNYSEQFTRSQKIIADYLRNDLDDVAFLTLDEISRKIGVSTTTVIRFARVLGYEGYSDLQKDIQNNLQNKASLPERLISQPNIPANTLLAQSFQNDIRNIQKTLDIQRSEDLDAAVSIISQAPSIYVLGMRSSFTTSFYMASRLGEIRENVRLIQSVGMIYPEELVSAKKGDVCIAYMFPRYSKATTTMLSWLKNEGVKIILITSQHYTAVQGYGDIILPCFISSISYKNSFAAPLCLSNYLVAAISQQNFEESQRILEKTESILSQGYYLGL